MKTNTQEPTAHSDDCSCDEFLAASGGCSCDECWEFWCFGGEFSEPADSPANVKAYQAYDAEMDRLSAEFEADEARFGAARLEHAARIATMTTRELLDAGWTLLYALNAQTLDLAAPRGRMVPAYTPTLPGIVPPIDPTVNELPPDNRCQKNDLKRDGRACQEQNANDRAAAWR
jgi:hypothetical protein